MSGLELDLSSAHDVVLAAARRGVPAVFGPVGNGDGDEGQGAGADLPAYDDDEAWVGRTVDGVWLARLLTGEGELHGHGLAVRGARILGGLDLEGTELPCRLELVGCHLGGHRIVLRDARTRTVKLSGVACGGVDADQVQVGGAFILRRAAVTGTVRLPDARIDASLVCDAMRIQASDRIALDAAHLHVAGSVHLRDGFRATGEVRLSGATIGGNLHLRHGSVVGGEVRLSGTTIGGNLHATGAHIDNPEGRRDPAGPPDRPSSPTPYALRANSAEVGGSVFLNDGFVARGHVQMFGLRVGGDLLCAAGRFDNPGGDALSLDGVHVRGGVFLERAAVAGRVRMVNGDLGGDLRCGGTRVEHPAVGVALYASRIRIAGNAFLDDGFAADGEVRLAGARIGGSLRCTSARLLVGAGGLPAGAAGVDGAGGPTVEDADEVVNPLEVEDPDRVAFNADAVQVGAEVRLDGGFTAKGRVRLFGATIGGGLDCRGAHLDGGGVGPALDMRGARVATYVMFSQGFTARGPVRFVGATIGGDVNCRGAQIIDPGRIELHGGAAPTPISLHGSGAQIGGTLFLTDGFRAEGEVRLLAISIGRDLFSADATVIAEGTAIGLTRARINGDAVLGRGSRASGTVRLARAIVGGNFDGGGGSFSAPDGRAIDAPNLQVGGSVLLRETEPGKGTTVEGEVHLVGSSIGGSVQLTGARITRAEGGHAVDATNVRVTGGFSAERASITGGLLLRGISVGGDLDCGGAHVVAPAGQAAVSADRAQITGSLLLNRDGGVRGPRAEEGRSGRAFRAEGGVKIRSATIGGHASCRGGQFSNPGQMALNLSGSRFAGDLMLSDGFSAEGEVRLNGAAVGSTIACYRGTFSQPDDVAFQAVGTQVTGSVMLSDGFSARGAVRLNGTTIGNDLDCRGGRFARPAGGATSTDPTASEGSTPSTPVPSPAGTGGRDNERHRRNPRSDDVEMALGAVGVHVTGSVMLGSGFSAEGEVGLQGATIGNDLDCSGGAFSHPSGVALGLAGVQVTGRVRLDDGFTARGRVGLPTATVGRDVSCWGGRFLNPGDDALLAVGARIAGTLWLEGSRTEGTVVLRDASVGTLRDEAASWPDTIDLDGFRYERLVCPPRDRGWRARRHWLRRQTTPSAQGYVGLAAVYRASGDELDARRILIERHNALLRPPEHWRDQLPSGPMELMRRSWRWVLRFTIGHGFAPGRSLLIALPLVAALALWLGHARGQDMLVPTDETAVTSARGEPRASQCDDRYPCLQPVVYALDQLVPIVELGQRSRWAPDQSHRGATWVDDGRWLAAATWATSALGWVLATLVAASFTQIVRRE